MPTLLPEFQLPAAGGGEAGTAELAQKREMLIALVHAPPCTPCEALMRELARRQGELAREEIAVRAVIAGPAGMPAAEGLPVALDADGHVWRGLAERVGDDPDAAVLIAGDRYTRVRSVLPVHEGEAAQLVEAAAEELRFAQMQCPECGVPTW